jgi:RNA methyltransferase, TrmH family
MGPPMNALLRKARSLQQKKARDQYGSFLVQGVKVVRELLASGWDVEAILATPEAALKLDLPRATLVPPAELARVGTLESGNEVVAIARKPAPAAVADLVPGELVLALDGISDPGNLGTVLRIADWFGIRRVWCSPGSVDAYNPKCVQASMGAIFRVRVDQVDLPQVLVLQQQRGAALYFASMEGQSAFRQHLVRPAVLVLGSESHGLSVAVRGLPGELVSVPGGGGSESLNVAAAAAALCMEFTRQHQS